MIETYTLVILLFFGTPQPTAITIPGYVAETLCDQIATPSMEGYIRHLGATKGSHKCVPVFETRK